MDSASSQIKHLIDRVRASAADATRLRIRGGGTKDAIGGALPFDGAELDLRPLTGVVSYEPSELVVTVRAGTPLVALEAVLAAQGQCLPFEPPRYAAGGTVGGMVAAGLSGPARATVGAVRDYVLGLEMLNGQAELLRFGGQVMKNVAGYDVSRLMTGSWGTLGAITEVSLKVLPVPPAEATLRFECDQAEALRRLHAWGGQPLPLNASCWVEDAGVGQLYVRLRGAKAAVTAACRSMGGTHETAASVADDWTACRDQQLPWFANRPADQALWRLSVPQTAPVLALPAGVAPPLVEWQGAQRWVQAPHGAGAALQQLAQAVGGNASLFIAASAYPVSDKATIGTQSPAIEQVSARMRQAFDPKGVFGPRRMGC